METVNDDLGHLSQSLELDDVANDLSHSRLVLDAHDLAVEDDQMQEDLPSGGEGWSGNDHNQAGGLMASGTAAKKKRRNGSANFENLQEMQGVLVTIKQMAT